MFFSALQGSCIWSGENFPRGYIMYYDGTTTFSVLQRNGTGQIFPEVTLYTMTAKTIFSCIARELHMERGKLSRRVFPTLHGRGKFTNSEVLKIRNFWFLTAFGTIFLPSPPPPALFHLGILNHLCSFRG